MINVSIRTTGERKQAVVEVTTTISTVLTDNSIDTAGKVFQINGANLQTSELGKSFADCGVADGATVMLSAVVKADSAN
jgi:hypothetical protein